jgi:hypothetical protein
MKVMRRRYIGQPSFNFESNEPENPAPPQPLSYDREGNLVDVDGNVYDKSSLRKIQDRPDEYLAKALRLARIAVRRDSPNIEIGPDDPLVLRYIQELRQAAEQKKPKQ